MWHPLDNVHGYCLDSFSQFVIMWKFIFTKPSNQVMHQSLYLGDLSVYNSRLKWLCDPWKSLGELEYLVLCIVMIQVCRKRELKCFLKVSCAIKKKKKKSHHIKLGCTCRFSIVLIFLVFTIFCLQRKECISFYTLCSNWAEDYIVALDIVCTC